jgi:hypothetical protein
VGGVVHGHVRLGEAAKRGGLEIITVAALKDVEFGIMDSGVDMVINSAISGSEMLGAIRSESARHSDKTARRLTRLERVWH